MKLLIVLDFNEGVCILGPIIKGGGESLHEREKQVELEHQDLIKEKYKLPTRRIDQTISLERVFLSSYVGQSS